MKNAVKLKITDLHGNTYRVRDMYLTTCPGLLYEGCETHSYNRDIITGRTMSIIKFNRLKALAVFHISWANVYVVYKLKFINYNELLDIRKSYLNGNIHNQKQVSKANGSNRNVTGLSKRAQR